MEQLPKNYFDMRQHGDIMSYFTNNIDRISEMLTDSLSDMLSDTFTETEILCLMIVINPVLMIITLITVP